MKAKDLKKVREQKLSQIYAALKKNKKEMSLVAAKMAAGKVKNLKSLKNLKKETAQLLTIITEKEIAERENVKTETARKK